MEEFKPKIGSTYRLHDTAWWRFSCIGGYQFAKYLGKGVYHIVDKDGFINPVVRDVHLYPSDLESTEVVP